jgi:hypothetical protein
VAAVRIHDLDDDLLLLRFAVGDDLGLEDEVAVEIAGRKYVSLARLIELKLASGLTAPDRPRDFDDVIQLIRKNTLGAHFADQLHPYVQPKYHELWGYAQRPSDLPE